MGRTLDLKGFLGHKTRGDNVGFLRGWKKRPGAYVETWLHTQAPIVALWQHSIPMVFEQKSDAGVVTRRVFGKSINCLEHEDVLGAQYKRDRDTDERIVPPVICPVCLLMEYFVGLYAAGEIEFTEKLFRWEGDDPRETVTLTFGGMLNRYSSSRLTTEQKEDMARNGVRGSEAWKESTQAKCNYVFTVVDNASPQDGIQIAVETTSLGDHVKECIADEMKRNAPDMDAGNPLLNPYCIRWEHHEKETQFQRKYKAIAMTRLKLTREVEDLIVNTPAPSLDHITKAPNVKQLWLELQAHYIGPVEIPWEELFAPSLAAGFGEREDGEDADEGDEADEVAPKNQAALAKRVASRKEVEAAPVKRVAARKDVEAAPAKRVAARKEVEADDEADEAVPPTPPVGRRRAASPPPPPPPEEDGDPCEVCGAAMKATDTTCPSCGQVYALDDEPQPAPKPAPVAAKRGSKLNF